MTDPRTALIATLLDGHTPADPIEAAHLASIRSLLATRPHPCDRDGFDPGHLTASGFVADTSRTRLLLIHHRRLDLWIQPGGHIDPQDATPERAARREVAEETGLIELEPFGAGLLDVDVHDYPARPGGDPAHRHFDLRFGYLCSDGRLRPNDEVHDARWVTAAELGELGVDESVRRPARKLLGAPGTHPPLG